MYLPFPGNSPGKCSRLNNMVKLKLRNPTATCIYRLSWGETELVILERKGRPKDAREQSLFFCLKLPPGKCLGTLWLSMQGFPTQ